MVEVLLQMGVVAVLECERIEIAFNECELQSERAFDEWAVGLEKKKTQNINH